MEGMQRNATQEQNIAPSMSVEKVVGVALANAAANQKGQLQSKAMGPIASAPRPSSLLRTSTCDNVQKSFTYNSSLMRRPPGEPGRSALPAISSLLIADNFNCATRAAKGCGKKRGIPEADLAQGEVPHLARSASPSPFRARSIGYRCKRRAVAAAVLAANQGAENAVRLARQRAVAINQQSN
ncbi:ARF1 [Symbiodinium natans]|uniref:ARF1 protein n=1 Tax=Symbiodinium natans TaxID=878477 RepID=A0A812S0B6_9DINO|nr:ARF1 [Symbiodinium natans]